MGHLVKSVREASIAECYRDVKEAHDYLVQQGAEAIRSPASQAAGSSVWGSEMKRLQVKLPEDGRPILIDVDVMKSEHNLGEVINQCATMERLLDTLVWVQTPESGLARFSVLCCHPTTSSVQEAGKKMLGDNDLVLMDTNNQYARFEIFDSVRDQPNNGKEKESLISLDVWRKGVDQESRTDWPAGRIFLAISQNLAPFLQRAKRPWLCYTKAGTSGQTCILELKPV